MKRKWILALSFSIIAVSLIGVAGVLATGGFGLDWWSVDGGGAGSGADSLHGDPYGLGGTIGQPDAGTSTSADGQYSVSGGYWAAAADLVPPEVTSILRAGASPTNLASVDFTVTFSEAVTGVDSGDFSLAKTGISGESITNVSGSGTTYTVTAGTGTGDGTLRLDLVDNDTILDLSGNPLGGTGTGNGNHTGEESYAIDKSAPVTEIATHPDDPTSSPDASFTFSSPDSGATFECSLDSVPFADCDSPKEYTGLGDGPHTFEVRGTDALGNVEDPAISFGWTIAHGGQTLTVSKDGTGTGKVTSLPTGIDCGATCEYAFTYNTSVTLTALADGNSTFTGWSDAACPGTGTCVLTMNHARSVTATFTRNIRRLYLPLVIR